MTVEASIFTAISSLCGNRVFPDSAPFGTAMPYVIYTQTGGEAFSYLENAVPSKQNGRFQFNVFGTTSAACKALIAQIEQALVTSTAFQARPIGAPVSTYDHDMNIYGSQIDMSIWSDR